MTWVSNYVDLRHSLNGDTLQTSFELTADAQAWPQKLNSAIGGDSNSIYLIVSDLGTPSGQGLDFINGQTFLYVHPYPYLSQIGCKQLK